MHGVLDTQNIGADVHFTTEQFENKVLIKLAGFLSPCLRLKYERNRHDGWKKKKKIDNTFD